MSFEINPKKAFVPVELVVCDTYRYLKIESDDTQIEVELYNCGTVLVRTNVAPTEKWVKLSSSRKDFQPC